MATSNYLCPRVGTELKHHVDVATTLSKYCAHLLLKKPKLLPGHQYDTRLVFGEVAAEAVATLQGEKNKYIAMARLPTGSGGDTKEDIFHKLGSEAGEGDGRGHPLENPGRFLGGDVALHRAIG